MKKIFTFFLITVFFTLNLAAQDDCECTNCPVTITDNSSFQAFLDVSVSGPNDLAACPLQQVCFTINHTWVGDLAVTLTSPGGTNYIVMGDSGNGSGGCGTNADNIDVCITTGTGNPLTNNTQYACNGGNPCLTGDWTVPCGGVTDPITNASQAPGCDLDAFNQSGEPANGTWTLTINDVCGADQGTLTDWSLDFACGVGSCVDCEAEGGSLNQQDVSGCTGSPALNLNITPTYGSGETAPTPAADYDYTFLVSQGGVLTPFSPLDGPNLNGLPPGDYTICGLSFENSQAPMLAPYFGQPVSVLAADLESDAAPFCGDVSNDCFDLTIGIPNPPIVRDTFGCANETLILPDGSACSPGTCNYSVDIGTGCPQEYTYVFVPIQPTTETVNETVCEGDCVTIEGTDYCEVAQVVNLTNEAGCDSVIVLNINFVAVDAEIADPDMLSCSNTSVTLDGSASTGDAFEWTDANGTLLGINTTLTVMTEGCYTLTAFNNSVSPPCTDEATVCVTQSGGGTPTPPNPTGDTPVCIGDNGMYSVIPEAGTTYNWTISGNGSIVAGQGTDEIVISWTSAGTADVCVTAENNCGTTAPECFAVTINDVPAQPVIAGDTPVCPNASASYTITPDPAAVSYNWTVPPGATITSGQGGTNITVLFGNAGGNVCVTANNACGNSPQACFPVMTVETPAPPNVTGPTEVCPGETVIYSTPADPNVSSFNWTLPACASLDSGQGTNTITVTWSTSCTTAGEVCVDLVTPCGAAAGDCLNVSIGSAVAAPNVTGTETVCLNDTETYSVTASNTVTDYQWTVTGGTIDSGNGTNTVTVTWTAGGVGQICNTLVTDCGTSTQDCLDVTVNEAPLTPVITGDTPLCIGESGSYGISSTLAGDETFNWTISGGGTVNGSNTGQTLNVDWTTAGTFDVCVTLENDCGSEQSCFPVTVNPATDPPTIGGPVSVCQNSTEQYFVTNPVAGETYTWTVPAGATVIDGPTSDMISVDWGNSAGGDVCVTAAGVCGTTAPVCLNVSTDGVPALGAVVGSDMVCVNETVAYSVGELSTATDYIWTTDCGTIASGQGTTAITLEIAPGCTAINLCVFAETDCGDTSPSCLTITVNDVPPAPTEITGTSPTCVSATETYCVTAVAGAESYDWTVTGGTIVNGQDTDCIEVEWTTAGDQDLCVSPVNNCGTGAEFCLPVAVSESTAMPEVTTPLEVCDCDETTAAVDMTDAVSIVWTVPTGATVTAGQGTGTITIDWCNGESGDVCAELTYDCGTVTDCATVEVFDLPTPNAGADDAICGLTYNLNAVSVFAGSMWTSPDAGVVFTDAADANTDVTVPDFGTYTFVWNETNGICSDSDEVVITFNASPAIDGTIDEVCNAANTHYTVTFTVTGGSEPFTADGITGSFTGNVFTSEEIISGAGYNFTLSNAEGCISQAYSGLFTCDCDTDAGTMVLDDLEACVDETVQAVHNGDEFLDGDDISQFILHDGDPVNGQIFAANNSGEFGLVPPMMSEVTYFISFAVGDDDGSGNVNLNAPCANFTAGIPVIFHAYPTPDAGADDAICGLTYELNAVSVFAGSMWTSADPAVTFTDAADANTEVTVPDFGTYTFLWNEENAGCAATDEVMITFNDAPVLADSQTEICDLGTNTYTVTFTITGGAAPYTVNGTEIVGTDFTSEPIDSNIPYSFSVFDANGCGPLLIEGVRDCDCASNAGTMEQTLQEACLGDTVSGLPNGDENNDGDDAVQYILHDGSGTTAGMIFAVSNTPDFMLAEPMQTGVTYYISTIIGNNTAGDGTVDMTDPCLSVAAGTPVLFNPLPDGSISVAAAICEGGTAILEFTFSGTAPFDCVVTTPDGDLILTDLPANHTQEVSPAATGDYTLIEVSDANGCTQTLTSTATVTVNVPPSATVAETGTVCNSAESGNAVTLDFFAFISAGDTGGNWVDTDNSGATGTFDNLDFTGLTPGAYTFTYTTASAIAPCTEVSYETEIIVEDCSCPSVATAAPDPLCNNGGTLNLTDLEITDEAGTWSLTAQPAGENAVLNGTLFDVTGLTPGDYTFDFILDVAPGDECPFGSQQTLTVNAAAEAGVPDTGLLFCEDTGANVDLFDNLIGADAGGTWTEVSQTPSAGNAFNAAAGSFNTNGQAPGVYVFRYTVTAVAPCNDDFSEVTITIVPNPTADAGPDGEISCTVESVTLGGAAVPGLSYAWTAEDGGMINPEEATDPNPTVFVGGTYLLTVTDDATGCQDTDEVSVSEALDLPFADFSVSNITCFGDSDGVISLDSVFGGEPPYVYSIDGENFNTTSFFSGLSGGTYTISVQDANGCINTVLFDIPEPEEVSVEIFAVLEDDNVIRFGDSVSLFIDYTPMLPFDSLDNVFWTPSEVLSCDTCEMVWASPLQSTNFSVTIEEGGCTATDNLNLTVRTDAPIFVPNAFSPNGDGQNDILYIFAGDQVEKVNSFVIYDRWGEAVHQFFEFLPNDPDFGWDGTWNGQLMNPAVFAWGAEVTLINGRTVVVKGDVTLVR